MLYAFDILALQCNIEPFWCVYSIHRGFGQRDAASVHYKVITSITVCKNR